MGVIAEELKVVIRAELSRAIQEFSKLDNHVKKTENSLKSISKNMSRVGKKMTKFVSLPLVGIGVAAIKSASDMQQLQASFETMLGSAENANKLLQDVENFSASTPFQLETLAKGTQTLLAFGTTADEIMPTLQMLGDVSLGNKDKFDSLTLAFAQVQSTGKLMGQDLLQMINAGFNPLQIISEQTGKSMAVLKDEMSKGAISAMDVKEAFRIATSEGGRFAGALEKQSKTFAGAFSTAMDNLKKAGRDLVKDLLPVLTDIVKKVTEMAKNFTELDDGTKKIILVMGALVAAAGPLLTVFSLIAAHPVIAAITALAAVIALVTNNIIQQDKALKESQNNWMTYEQVVSSHIDDIKNGVSSLSSEVNKLNITSGQIIPVSDTTARIKLLNAELKDTQDKLNMIKQGPAKSLFNLPSEAQLDAIAKEEAKYTVKKENLLKEIASLEKKELANSKKNALAAIERRKRIAEQQERIQQELEQRRILMIEGGTQEELALAEERTQKILEMEKAAAAERERIIQSVGQAGIQVANALGQAIVQGISGSKEAWKGFAKAGLNAIASVIDAMAQLELGKAIAALASPLTAPTAPGHFAAAAALGALAGGIKAIPLKSGGSFTVPNGNPNDSFMAPLALTSGEKVEVTPLNKQRNGNGVTVIQKIEGNVYREQELAGFAISAMEAAQRDF